MCLRTSRSALRVVTLFLGLSTSAWSSPEATPSAAKNEKEGLAAVLRDFAADPKLKNMMWEQHLVLLKDVFMDFARQRRLNSRQAEDFFLVILSEEIADSDDTDAMLDGDIAESTKSGSSAEKRATHRDRAEQTLRLLLGDAGYASYLEYLKTISERIAMAEFGQQLRLKNIAISDEQTKMLLEILWDERGRTEPVAYEPRSLKPMREKYRIALQGDNAKRFFVAQRDLDARFLVRAAAFLDKTQLEALEKFQKQWLAVEEIGLEHIRRAYGAE